MTGPPIVVGIVFYFAARRNIAFIEFFGHSIHATYVIFVYLINYKVFSWEPTEVTRNNQQDQNNFLYFVVAFLFTTKSLRDGTIRVILFITS